MTEQTEQIEQIEQIRHGDLLRLDTWPEGQLVVYHHRIIEGMIRDYSVHQVRKVLARHPTAREVIVRDGEELIVEGGHVVAVGVVPGNHESPNDTRPIILEPVLIDLRAE